MIGLGKKIKINKKSYKFGKKSGKRGKRKKAKTKYNKLFIELWKCGDCDFEWTYKTIKCPICASGQTVKLI